MLRSYGMLMGTVVMGLGLAVSGCGDREGQTKEDPAPVEADWSPQNDEDALIGQWSDGGLRLRFDRGGRYYWQQGGRDVNGKWSIRRGKIYLEPPGANDEVYEFGFADRQNSLELSRNGGHSWRLSRN